MTERRKCAGDFATRDRLYGVSSVWVLVGLPRCGKSTWANHLRSTYGATILSPDDIRRALGVQWDRKLEPVVWRTFNLMAKVLVLRGQNIIVDSTNLTRASRKMWVEMAKRHEIRLEFVCFVDPPDEVLRERCQKSGYPWEVVQQLRQSRQAVMADEGLMREAR